jgi:hypothetical protein
MRSLCALFGVGVIVGLLPSPASATSLTLQYDLTITQRCGTSPGSCSAVNIGGLPLTLTTIVGRSPLRAVGPGSALRR